jgi:hypothetical protein
MDYILMRWLLLAFFVMSLLLQIAIYKLCKEKRKKYALLYPLVLVILALWSVLSLMNSALPYPDIVKQVGFFGLPDSAYGLLFIGSAFAGSIIGSVMWKLLNVRNHK